MTIAELTALIGKSTLLSVVEKAYWAGMLASMNPQQMEKLERILTDAERIPMQQHVHEYYDAVRKRS